MAHKTTLVQSKTVAKGKQRAHTQSRTIPKSLKIAQVKALLASGQTYRNISKMLGIAQKTIARYKKIEREDIAQMAHVIQMSYLEQDFKLNQLATNKLTERISEAKYYELIQLYKTSRDLQTPRTTNNQINANAINIQVIKDKKAGVFEIIGSDTEQ